MLRVHTTFLAHPPVLELETDLVLVDIELNGLQLLHFIWETLDFVLGQIHHIQVSELT